MMTVTRVDEIPQLRRPETTGLAETETTRMAELLAELDDNDWAHKTDCPAWTVRDMAGHVLGMTETFARLPNFARDMRAGGKAAGDGPFIDGLTAVQVERNASATTDEVIERLRVAGPRQAKWRASRRLMRHIPLKQEMPDGTTETWKLAFLVDVILTRDTWMHRVDITHATGRPMVLTAEHDGRIVADVVAEWARRHGKPFTLTLTGAAGGTYASGDAGESLELDAVDFCRILSGRASAEGLLSQEVPF